MDSDQTDNQKTSGTNPLVAIAVAVAVALLMVTVTTVSFLRSGAYTTVKQIQIGTRAVASINETDLDINSPINASDIDDYAAGIKQRLQAIDDYADFGPDAVSDSSLKL